MLFRMLSISRPRTWASSDALRGLPDPYSVKRSRGETSAIREEGSAQPALFMSRSSRRSRERVASRHSGDLDPIARMRARKLRLGAQVEVGLLALPRRAGSRLD